MIDASRGRLQLSTQCVLITKNHLIIAPCKVTNQGYSWCHTSIGFKKYMHVCPRTIKTGLELALPLAFCIAGWWSLAAARTASLRSFSVRAHRPPYCIIASCHDNRVYEISAGVFKIIVVWFYIFKLLLLS